VAQGKRADLFGYSLRCALSLFILHHSTLSWLGLQTYEMVIMKDRQILPGDPYDITVSVDGPTRRMTGIVHGLAKVKMVNLSSGWLQDVQQLGSLPTTADLQPLACCSRLLYPVLYLVECQPAYRHVPASCHAPQSTGTAGTPWTRTQGASSR
jgi:hypothetical protein